MPDIIGCDESLMVIEMTIVTPPFVLDFAGARLDSPPDYPPEVLEEWESEKEEQFEDDWPVVRSVMAEFESYGIFLCDLHPGNIRLRAER